MPTADYPKRRRPELVREVLIVRPSACAPRAPQHPAAQEVAQRIGAYLIATNRQPDGIVARVGGLRQPFLE